jgi:ribonuclease P protein component
MSSASAGEQQGREAEGFDKSGRLRKRREFLTAQQKGRKIHLRDLLVFVHPRQGERRVGFTVTTKVGRAVQRNRIKRVLREIWRRNRDMLPDGLDVIFVAKRTAVNAQHGALRLQFVELAQRLQRGTHG